MEILLVPHPVLRQKANKLKTISKEDIKIANHMMETMIKAPGVGLAANQVGILKQIVTINFEDKENNKKANYILFNPSIIQFLHRSTAYLLLFFIIILNFIYLKKQYDFKYVLFFDVAILFQIFLGIITLISGVEIKYASLHQLGSILVLSSYFLILYKNSN